MSALALNLDFPNSKHSTLKGWFNQTQVKTNNIDVSFGKTYARAFEKRQKADYDDFAEFEEDEVKTDLENAKAFVKRVKKFIHDNMESQTNR